MELPLPLRHLGIDAFMIDTGVEAQIEMLLDNLAADRAHVRKADARVIRTLRCGITVGRETERTAVLVEEILLLESEPGAVVVQNGCPLVRRMRGAVLSLIHISEPTRLGMISY